MKFSIVFHVEAQDEAIEAARYIAEQTDNETAVRWYSGLVAAARSLSEMPERCSTAPEDEYVSNAKLRQLIYYAHRLIFTVDDGVVQILHVRHQARQALDATELTPQGDAPTNFRKLLTESPRFDDEDTDRGWPSERGR